MRKSVIGSGGLSWLNHHDVASTPPTIVRSCLHLSGRCAKHIATNWPWLHGNSLLGRRCWAGDGGMGNPGWGVYQLWYLEINLHVPTWSGKNGWPLLNAKKAMANERIRTKLRCLSEWRDVEDETLPFILYRRGGIKVGAYIRALQLIGSRGSVSRAWVLLIPLLDFGADQDWRGILRVCGIRTFILSSRMWATALKCEPEPDIG